MDKSLYEQIYHLIKDEKFKAYRSRGKIYGYMWDGYNNVELKDGRKISFDLWHHYFEDDGSINWVPSEYKWYRANDILQSVLNEIPINFIMVQI